MKRFKDDNALGNYVADKLVDILIKKPNATFCIAAGTTSFPVFNALKERVQSGKISFSEAAFFAMDEWCGLPMGADGAMADFLQRHFLNEMDFGNVFLFDGLADPESECIRAEQFIADHGGLDVIVFGIGVNGHVALNEPGVDPKLRTHVAQVAEITATVAQKYFKDDAPPLTTGITIGLANAADTPALYLIANTAVKRAAVEQIQLLASAGTPSCDVPASFIATMPNSELLVTEAVFS